jgi:hypothetical protein
MNENEIYEMLKATDLTVAELNAKLKRLEELESKLKNGKLVELPCMHKTVFGHYRVIFFSKIFNHIDGEMFNYIDSETFFNKAEAEKKLKELRSEE